MTFDPMSVEVTCVTLPKDHCVQIPWEYINVRGRVKNSLQPSFFSSHGCKYTIGGSIYIKYEPFVFHAM